MPVPAGDQSQQQQNPAFDGEEDFPGVQLPPIPITGAIRGTSSSRRRRPFAAAGHGFVIRAPEEAAQHTAFGREQPSKMELPERPSETTPERPLARRNRSDRRRSSVAIVAQLSTWTLRPCGRMVDRLLQWFAARPLGQRALDAVRHAIATAEWATLWAGTATDQAADRPGPFTRYIMVPIVVVLTVVRTGAALVERYLHVQPSQRELVNWLQRQRIYLEQLQDAAAVNIRTVCVDKNDPTHRFLNTWPFSILYRAVQQLGIIPVRVVEQPSEAESPSIPNLESMMSSSSSRSLMLTESKEQAAPSSRQTEELPTKTEKEAIGAATAVVPRQPWSPPEYPMFDEAQRAAMGVLPLPPPPRLYPTSEDMLAVERISHAEPGTSNTAQTPPPEAPKTFFYNLFASKSGEVPRLQPRLYPTSQDMLAVERAFSYEHGTSNTAQQASSKAPQIYVVRFK